MNAPVQNEHCVCCGKDLGFSDDRRVDDPARLGNYTDSGQLCPVCANETYGSGLPVPEVTATTYLDI
jgi:hypothetical protein